MRLPAWRGVATVGATYLAQGMVAGLGFVLIDYLAALEIPLEAQVGVLASGAVPWALKFVFALVLDLGPSWSLRARGVALSAIAIAAAALAWTLAGSWQGGAGPLPRDLSAVAISWVALNLAMASQDVIVDGLALDVLGEHRTATATAMGLGHAIGFGVLHPLIVTPRILAGGMPAGVRWIAVAVAMLAALPAVLLWAPGTPTKARASRDREPAQPSVPVFVALLVVFVLATVGPNITQAVSAELLITELQWSFEQVSETLLPIAAVAGLLGVPLAGLAVARFGAPHTAAIACVGLATAWLVFAGLRPHWTADPTIVGMACAEGLLQPAMLVGLHALALTAAARSPLPTTGFVVAMAALNLPRVLAPLLAPDALASLGWVGFFALSAGFSAVAAGILAMLHRPLASDAPPSTPLAHAEDA